MNVHHLPEQSQQNVLYCEVRFSIQNGNFKFESAHSPFAWAFFLKKEGEIIQAQSY